MPASAPPKSCPSCGSPQTATESGGDIKVLSLQQATHTPELPTILAEALSILNCSLISSFAQSGFFYSQVLISNKEFTP